MFERISDIEDRLWKMADDLRANTPLRSSEYSTPVLGLIFLKFADEKFAKVDQAMQATTSTSRRYTPTPASYRALGAIYLPEEARLQYLIDLPGTENCSEAVNKAMELIEQYNSDLGDALPTTAYTRLDKDTLHSLLCNFAAVSIDPDMEGDPFGRICQEPNRLKATGLCERTSPA